MAIPENHKWIATNLPEAQLEKFLEALKDKRAQQVPGSVYVFGIAGEAEFDFEGIRYRIRECFEELISVDLVSASSVVIAELINELERELAVVVNARDYDKAKKINRRVQDLTRIWESTNRSERASANKNSTGTYKCLLCGTTTSLPHICPVFKRS